MTIVKPTTRFVFTPQHQEIIEAAFFPYHLLLPSQVTMLLRPTLKLGNMTTIQERLKALVANKYLQATHVPTSEGQRPHVYCLGMRGRRLLADFGKEVPVYFEPYQLADFTHDWYTHPLELNNFLITAATLPVFESRLSFSDLQHDLAFARKPLEWIDEKGTLRTPKPDAIFKLHLRREGQADRHFLMWIELDRGHHNPVKFRQKLAAIWDLFSRGYHEQYFQAKSMHVCFVTTAGEKRLEAMRSLARMEFGKDINPKKAKNRLFKFASIPPLTQYADYWKYQGARQPLPLTTFCSPFWLSAYGGDEKLTLIDLHAD